MTQDTTPTEEKESDATLWSSVVILTITVFALVGGGFLLYHSTTILGFVFKPWMQEDTHDKEIEDLRYEISLCAKEPEWVELSTGATSTESMQDCLKNL